MIDKMTGNMTGNMTGSSMQMAYLVSRVGVRVARGVALRIGRVALSAMMLAVVAQPALSQTRFHWADSRFEIGKYPFLEACYAVNSRVIDSVKGKSPQLIDTLHHTVYNGATPLPPVVVESTKRCLQRFNVDELPLETAFLAQQLYLDAGEDAKALRMIERKLASIPADSSALLNATFEMAFTGYYEAQPVRVQGAIALYERYEAYGARMPILERIIQLGKIMNAAWYAKDSATFNRMFEKAVQLAKSFDETQWEDNEGVHVSWLVMGYSKKRYAAEFDSALRVGTQAYFELSKQRFTQLVGRTNRAEFLFEPVEGVVSERSVAPPIAADYWFPAKAPNVSYPRKGQVTVIMTTKASHNDQFGSLVEATMAKRLKQKFPDIEIVVLAATAGYFNALEPPTPEHEGALNDSLYRQFFKIPGVLAVSNTKFWRLPGYDRRRINEKTENEENGYGSQQGMTQGWVYLVDKAGTVVLRTSATIRLGGERDLEQLIPLLLNQPVRSQGADAPGQ